MNVLITGINGRIGQYVAKGLLSKGYEVLGIDIADNINPALSKCLYVKADITNISDLEEALKDYKIDQVVHLAALAHFSSNNITIEDFMKINCEAALNVAKVAHMCGAKKFLFSSTVEVYGQTDELIINENTTCNPKTNYGKSKYEAEKELDKYLKSVGIEFVVYRFTPVYLKEYTKDLDKRVILPKGIGAFYFKDGKHQFSLCSVNNIVDSVIAFVQGKIENGIYIVSDKQALTAKDIAIMKKDKGEAKRVVKMPYGLIYIGLSMLSWILEKLGKAEKGLLFNNLNKLVKPICYDSSKINQKIELKWNIMNTLYSNE